MARGGAVENPVPWTGASNKHGVGMPTQSSPAIARALSEVITVDRGYP